MRTAEEIKKAIEFFKKQKDTLPKYSAFGDPNHFVIDKQLEVLDGNLNDDEIWELEDDDDGNYLDDMNKSEIVNVYDWMQGEDMDIFGE